MKLNKFLFSTFMLAAATFFVSCEDETSKDNNNNSSYVSFVNQYQTVGIPAGETHTVEGKVIASTATGSDRVYNLEVVYESVYNTANDVDPLSGSGVLVTTANPDYFTVPATVTIPAGSREGVFQVSISAIDAAEQRQIVIGLVPVSGTDMAMTYVGTKDNGDYEAINERLVIKFKEEFVCDENHISIEIVTDNYGSETTWELYDSALTLIASGGPYTDSVAAQQELRDLCLSDGHYTFVAYDAYGDGMYDGTNQGYYAITKYDASGTGTVIAQNGTFATDEVVEFDLP